jgi:hypothetical protein
VADGKVNVGVAVIVGDDVMVGVKVSVGVRVSVGVKVNVGVGVFVHEAAVAVMAIEVRVACSSAEGAHADTAKTIRKATRNIFIKTLPAN